MGRPLRACHGGYVYQVLNRANGRLSLFRKDGVYDAFLCPLTDGALFLCALPFYTPQILYFQRLT